jgi:hypothetical protein
MAMIDLPRRIRGHVASLDDDGVTDSFLGRRHSGEGDCGEGTLEVAFRPTGIRTLAAEVAQQAEVQR